MREHALLASLPAVLGATSGRVRVGIGDDAAVLAPGSGSLVVSTDTVVEDVHFRRAWLSLADVGYRATMAALSDLAAMGAAPLAVVAAVTFPEGADEASLREVLRGQDEACRAASTPLVGGNLSRGPSWSLTTTVLGETERPLLRSGARPGDRVLVAGPLGLAALGRERLDASPDGDDDATGAFRRPSAQIQAGLSASSSATAAIDVSDGLVGDLEHLARASHVTVSLVGAACSAAGGPALAAHPRALELALHGGDDYALVVTAPAPPSSAFVDVGVVLAFDGAWVRVDGREEASRAFDHGVTG